MEEKVFDFNYIIIVGINYLLNDSFNKIKLQVKSILYFAINQYTLRKFRQTLKTAPHCGEF
jgi:hypothetical protein